MERCTIGDAVIITLRVRAALEYYGIVEFVDDTQLSILGNPLKWVLAGNLKLNKYTFILNSIEDVKLHKPNPIYLNFRIFVLSCLRLLAG